MHYSYNVDLTLSNWSSAVSALQQSKWHFHKLRSLSEDAKFYLISSNLPNSGSEPFKDWNLSFPLVLHVTKDTQLFKKLTKTRDGSPDEPKGKKNNLLKQNQKY